MHGTFGYNAQQIAMRRRRRRIGKKNTRGERTLLFEKVRVICIWRLLGVEAD
jgi:hypothetical protein